MSFDGSHDRRRRLEGILTGAGLSGKFTEVEGLSVHWAEKGEGSPLVLVHGLHSSVYTWRYNFESLALHFRVLAVDLPGFGLSDRPEGFPWDVGQYAVFLESFLASEGIELPMIVGHSLGGAIGSELIRRGVAGVRKIVLAAPSIPGHTKVPEKIMANLLLFTYHNKSMLTPELINVFKLTRFTMDCHQNAHFLNPPALQPGCFLRDEPAGTPCLIIWGENDAVVPPDTAEEIKKWYQHPNHEVFLRCGHAPHEEMPDSFNRLVLDFLEI